MRIRRNPGEFSAEDRRRWPIWEYALDEEGEPGQDETTMRPVTDAHRVVPGDYRVVGAEFQLRDGRRFLGTIEPWASGGSMSQLDAEYVIEFDLGDVLVPKTVVLCGARVGKVPVEWFDKWMFDMLARLGATFNQAFPIRVRPLAPVSGWPAEWELPGFIITDRSGQRMVTEP